MPKAFLAHSSKEKGYVNFVADKLNQINCVYDSKTFEEGMKTYDEIEKGLEKSDIFVLFISDAALNSPWVRTEIEKAYSANSQGFLKRIYPIIIDPAITYTDSRIPLWMREEYNLKYVSRPVIAVRRIKQRLREISWDFHPRIKERDQIFVGRNDLIKSFEERVDSIDSPLPVCFIAGGLKRIGRSSLLLHCFKKANIISPSYKPPIIKLSSHESLEDFIYKVYDLGFSSNLDLTNFMTKSVNEKISIALKLIRDLQSAKEILYIRDDGCIVTPERIISGWFTDILLQMKQDSIVTFAISSRFRMLRYNLHNLEHIFVIEVPELQKTERQGLLRRYAEFEGLELRIDDFKFMSELLNGYPEQVFYTVDLIKEIGLSDVKKNSHLIIDFTTEKVVQVLDKYEKDEKAINFLYLLSRFDFISFDLISELVDNEQAYFDILKDFFASAICEFLGANKEYVRVNDAIRDYISRIRVSLAQEHLKKLKEHHEKFLREYKSEEKDASDFLYSMQLALLSGETVDEKYLIPSHYLNTMIEHYNNQAYKEVIKLADVVLQNSSYMDNYIEREIRFFLCLSLARLRDTRFKTEAQKIEGPQHDFLFGFYYRLVGDGVKAVERLKKVLVKNSTCVKLAKRELVQSYIYLGEYDKAIDLARENYEGEKNNPYHIQAYFECLIRDYKNKDANRDKINELLSNLERIESEKAGEIFLNLKAQYLAFFENDEQGALKIINEAIGKIPESFYLKLTKCDICNKFNNLDEMGKTLAELKIETENRPYFQNFYLRKQVIYLAKIGEYEAAEDLINMRLKNLPEESRQKLKNKVDEIKDHKASSVNII